MAIRLEDQHQFDLQCDGVAQHMKTDVKKQRKMLTTLAGEPEGEFCFLH